MKQGTYTLIPCGAAERLPTGVVSLVEYLSPENRIRWNGFAQVMDHLSKNQNARWFTGAALNSADHAIASVICVRTRLRLYFDWSITFGDPYILLEKFSRKVACVG